MRKAAELARLASALGLLVGALACTSEPETDTSVSAAESVEELAEDCGAAGAPAITPEELNRLLDALEAELAAQHGMPR